ncbi:hypothetical protein Hanom_Chr12g01118011 [Helianthus anomalus]
MVIVRLEFWLRTLLCPDQLFTFFICRLSVLYLNLLLFKGFVKFITLYLYCVKQVILHYLQ